MRAGLSKFTYFALFLGGVSGFYLFQSQMLRSQVAGGRDVALIASVAQKNGIPPNDLSIASRDVQSFETTGLRLEIAKVVDEKTGQTYLTALDTQGNVVDLAQVQAAESRGKKSKFGKIHPALDVQMRGNGNGSNGNGPNRISVAIWLAESDVTVTRPDTPDEDVSSAVAAMLNSTKQQLDSKRQGLINAITRMGGGAQAVASPYAPVVFASLTAGQINAISQRDDVGTIYGDVQNTKFSDDAATTERAYKAWAQGALGKPSASLNVPGIPPVVHEDDGIYDLNPYLSNGSHGVFYWCSDVDLIGRCPSGKNTTASHASIVAGVIASTHPLYRGIAPSVANLLSANFQSFASSGFDQRMVDSFEWARANRGDPTNMSWGTNCGGGLSFFQDRYLDWATRNLGATFVVSSGNTRGCSGGAIPDDYYVSSPGTAWSVITVGAVDDNDNGFWSGDFVAGYSRYIDPLTGQDKPEVVAVGSDRVSTDNAGGDHISPPANGTSFSAPAVAGQVSLLLGRKPGQTSWPETNKAAVLVSTWHDVVAGTEVDGMGAVVMNTSDDTYQKNRFGNDSVTVGTMVTPCEGFVSSTCKIYANKIAVTTAMLGIPIRVAIAYDSYTSAGCGNPALACSDALGADLDLYVIAPNNTSIVCSSTGVSNAWELCQFTPAVTGSYDIQVRHFGSVGGWPGTFLGYAWAQRVLPDFCTGNAAAVTSTLGTYTRSVNTTNGTTWFDSYAGWGFAQGAREGVIPLTLSTIRDITISDTNANMDLHLITIPSCTTDPISPTIIAQNTGAAGQTIVLNNLAAGQYYIVVDGRTDGAGLPLTAPNAIGTDSVTVVVAGP